MAQPSPLSPSLIRKGEAKPVSPETAIGTTAAQPAPPEPVRVPPVATAPPELAPAEPRAAQETPATFLEDLAMPDTVSRALVSFRAPVQLTEELRLMAFETRRPKQDLLTEFLSEGLKRWKAARARRGR